MSMIENKDISAIKEGNVMTLMPQAPPFRAGDKFFYRLLALYSLMLYNICMEYKSNLNVVYSCKYHAVY
jgi:hypothetical protein